MKFLLDAQLPPSLKQLFVEHGYDCIHTLDLDAGNDTADIVINQLSVLDQRIVITKDVDFYDSFLLKAQPYKLVLVKLGNTSKKELLQFFQDRFAEIIEQMKTESLLVLKKER